LELTSTLLPHLEACWIPSLQTFLDSINATIKVDNPYIPPLQRQGDKHIMDCLITSKAFLPKDLQRINSTAAYTSSSLL
jgi:hypothetical protein